MATPAQSLPPTPEREQPGLADLMGGGETQPNPRDKEQASRAFVGQVKEIHTSLEDIARQYPAFAEAARKAQEAIKDGMVRALSAMQGQEESGNVPRMA